MLSKETKAKVDVVVSHLCDSLLQQVKLNKGINMDELDSFAKVLSAANNSSNSNISTYTTIDLKSDCDVNKIVERIAKSLDNQNASIGNKGFSS